MSINEIKSNGSLPFPIHSYGVGELARIYSPDICADAALRKLKRWINLQPALVNSLKKSGFSSKTRALTPSQVRMIVEALGEP